MATSASVRLKNANEDTCSLAVWRYHHYRSRVDYATKRATVFSTLRKVDRMASDPEQLTISAMAKCKAKNFFHPPGGEGDGVPSPSERG